MIEKPAREFTQSDLRQFLRFRHRRMRALGYERVERRNPAPRQKLRRQRKQNVGVVVACFVGNDGEDAFAGLDDVEGFVNYAG